MTARNFARAISGGQRLFEILDAKSPVQEAGASIKMLRVQGHIRFENVGFAYNHNETVISDIEIDAQPGQVVALLGAPGSGKSTLLRVMAGVLRPAEGSICLEKTELNELPPRTRAQQIAYLPQNDANYPFTALETVLMARYPHLSRFALEGNSDRQIARSALTKTETTQFENHHLDHISGGERQRVMLAKALAQHARVLLLDEPVASLDLRHQLLAMETLRSEVSIRNIRRDAMDKIKEQEKNNEISEDEQKNVSDNIQKLTDEKVNEIQSVYDEKKNEIMQV